MVGGEGIKERADFLAMAVRKGITLRDLATMENVYSPPIGALNEPIALAAQDALARLGSEVPFARCVARRAEAPSAQLMVAAQRDVAVATALRHRRRRGASTVFWQRVYVPVYHRLPWKLRATVMRRCRAATAGPGTGPTRAAARPSDAHEGSTEGPHARNERQERHRVQRRATESKERPP